MNQLEERKPVFFGSLNNRICYKPQFDILDGCILPDFLQDANEKDKIKVIKKYGSMFYNKYKKVCRLANVKIWSSRKKYKKNIINQFHGKSKMRLKQLKRTVLKTVKNPRYDKKDKKLLIGCCLHSIQDYSAHSFVSDLEEFKKSKWTNQNDIILTYHSDWTVMGKGKKAVAERKRIHSCYKDNPKMDFKFIASGGIWIEKDTYLNNTRYHQAVINSKDFLKLTNNELKWN